VVRDAGVWHRVPQDVVDAAAALGLGATRAMASPLPGPAGNVEFLLHLERGVPSTMDLEAAVAEGEGLRP
jgi:23S rRNA (cytidine1920-2'-O)/16S rRNA (cytidine1409-2'-O)-methyltransferase